jgi:hypothetical protein
MKDKRRDRHETKKTAENSLEKNRDLSVVVNYII